MRQYWFETISELFVLTVVFLGLFFGIKSYLLPDADASQLDGLLFGYIIWTFATTAFHSVTRSVTEINQKGFLEQLYLCPEGFSRLLLAKVFSSIMIGLILTLLLAYIAMFLTGNWIELNIVILVPLLLLAAPSVVGLGLILGGLTGCVQK